MDPNLFHIDWERTLEALVAIVILSFVVERACAILFESRWWIRLFDEPRVGEPPGSDPSTGGSTSKKTKKTAARAASSADEPDQPEKPAAGGAASRPESPATLRPGRRYPLKEVIAFAVPLQPLTRTA
jgi:hypothetical protein